jgi:hypothetical protein
MTSNSPGLGGGFSSAFGRLRGGGLAGDAVNDLGLGGMLKDQVAGESEEQRKKRMAQIAERAMMGPEGTLGTYSLFGGGARGAGPYT